MDLILVCVYWLLYSKMILGTYVSLKYWRPRSLLTFLGSLVCFEHNSILLGTGFDQFMNFDWLTGRSYFLLQNINAREVMGT